VSKRWSNKYIVGLTGNIATGKSVVLELAGKQGALTIDADQIVHELLGNDSELQDAIERSFGSDARNPDGSINRASLGAMVFKSGEKLAVLERIVHPAVHKKLLSMIDESDKRIVFIEAIKLLESGLSEECDQIWVTRCPPEVRFDRLIKYRGMQKETAAQRVAAQPSQDAKIVAADVVIDTAGSLDETAEFFRLAWRRMLRIVPGPIAVWQQKQVTAAEKAYSNSILRSRSHPEDGGIEGAPVVDLGSGSGLTSGKPLVEADQSENVFFQTEDVTIQRATPSDVPDILWLIRRTAGSAVRTKRRELLMTLGERGYLIGRKEGEISTLAGWSSENLVATVDLIIINPPEAAFHTGAAILQEIEDTANSLVCEVILAFPPTGPSLEMRQLFAARGYIEIQKGVLPKTWQTAVEENQPYDTLIWMKILRDIRQLGAV
jgi:dephospho-CoA kinase